MANTKFVILLVFCFAILYNERVASRPWTGSYDSVRPTSVPDWVREAHEYTTEGYYEKATDASEPDSSLDGPELATDHDVSEYEINHAEGIDKYLFEGDILMAKSHKLRKADTSSGEVA